jgi:RNA polymerase sigma-70 factor (ECF subfamily)
MQQLSDEEVMLSYQKGQVEAMDELLRRYKVPIYQFAFRMSGNAVEAEDIAQEVFLRVHQSRSAYQPSGKFSTWIFTITHNLSLSRLRRKKQWALWPRQEDNPDAQVEFASSDPSPEEIVSGNELSDILKRCIQSLPFLQREALVLREYQGLDYQEIAKILNKSLGTVKTLIHRARQNLKDKLLPYAQELKKGGL